ncbi:uncharacterized protein F4822DRAFT_434646 [Hypoxylon trugodes]|uniref:uncharacterized protein n=1 Tax=Hypoxylon trugodes TaxID=326681 RepID=UPI002193F2CC|nr:uncharacterized protein F4822DRAFT_434646 [Hypoxylon trugodes]KAI1383534.1 hypothetical protein F4822DRAFT_434646 [Hypoxylon trugodes]
MSHLALQLVDSLLAAYEAEDNDITLLRGYFEENVDNVNGNALASQVLGIVLESIESNPATTTLHRRVVKNLISLLQDQATETDTHKSGNSAVADSRGRMSGNQAVLDGVANRSSPFASFHVGNLFPSTPRAAPSHAVALPATVAPANGATVAISSAPTAPTNGNRNAPIFGTQNSSVVAPEPRSSVKGVTEMESTVGFQVILPAGMRNGLPPSTNRSTLPLHQEQEKASIPSSQRKDDPEKPARPANWIPPHLRGPDPERIRRMREKANEELCMTDKLARLKFSPEGSATENKEKERKNARAKFEENINRHLARREGRSSLTNHSVSQQATATAADPAPAPALQGRADSVERAPESTEETPKSVGWTPPKLRERDPNARAVLPADTLSEYDLSDDDPTIPRVNRESPGERSRPQQQNGSSYPGGSTRWA